jgi:hypothetical protein
MSTDRYIHKLNKNADRLQTHFYSINSPKRRTENSKRLLSNEQLFKRDINLVKSTCKDERCDLLEKRVDTLFNDIKKCSNGEYTFSLEPIRVEDGIIPLKYNVKGKELTVCYSYNEIFDLLYSRIRDENLNYIPDMYYPEEKMNNYNKSIILSYDKRLNQSRISNLLTSKNTSNIKDMLSQDDKRFLKENVKGKENIEAFYNFIIWYTELPESTKEGIDNFVVKTLDGKQTPFGVVIENYIQSKEERCVKEFISCLKQFMSTVGDDEDKLEEISEEDEEEELSDDEPSNDEPGDDD